MQTNAFSTDLHGDDEFLGHYFGHDVWLCDRQGDTAGGSVVARCGDAPHEYASAPLVMLRQAVKIESYAERLFSDVGPDAEAAMILALAVKAMD